MKTLSRKDILSAALSAKRSLAFVSRQWISMSESSEPRVQISSISEEDEFWLCFAKSLISKVIDGLDDRAQFMVTTSASLLVADFAILVIAAKESVLKVSPQFFLALSALSFIASLFPRKYTVNPWLPDNTKQTYSEILNHKIRYHLIGFSMFFIALILIALSALFT